MERPRVIHDFYGFPRELFDFNYPAPGAPDVALEVTDLVKPSYVGLDHDSWGLNHGTWSVLAHVFPDASVPVLQLSLHAGQGPQYHLDLGRKLAPLRDTRVFVLGSGNVVHNLRRVNPACAEQAYDWGQRFNAEVRRIMTTAPGGLTRIAPGLRAVGSDARALPAALHLAGPCEASGQAATALAEGATMGSLTMTSYALGWAPDRQVMTGASAAGLPDAARGPTGTDESLTGHRRDAGRRSPYRDESLPCSRSAQGSLAQRVEVQHRQAAVLQLQQPRFLQLPERAVAARPRHAGQGGDFLLRDLPMGVPVRVEPRMEPAGQRTQHPVGHPALHEPVHALVELVQQEQLKCRSVA